jgi:hypothetical protein
MIVESNMNQTITTIDNNTFSSFDRSATGCFN